jgi:hypothetical protein
LTDNAGNPPALIATINADMLYGSMSSLMQTRLNTLLSGLSGGGTSPAETAWSAIYVTMLSPEYTIQR